MFWTDADINWSVNDYNCKYYNHIPTWYLSKLNFETAFVILFLPFIHTFVYLSTFRYTDCEIPQKEEKTSCSCSHFKVSSKEEKETCRRSRYWSKVYYSKEEEETCRKGCFKIEPTGYKAWGTDYEYQSSETEIPKEMQEAGGTDGEERIKWHYKCL